MINCQKEFGADILDTFCATRCRKLEILLCEPQGSTSRTREIVRVLKANFSSNITPKEPQLLPITKLLIFTRSF